MKKIIKHSQQLFASRRQTFVVVIALINILLLVFAITLYSRYAALYEERLHQENLGNIASLNRSAASSATSLINSWNSKLDDITQYVVLNDYTLNETLATISDANSDRSRFFELVGSDYSGYLAQRDSSGSFIPLSYQGSSYSEIQKIIDDADNSDDSEISFVPEFTDSVTALKYFATYRHLSLKSEDGKLANYILMLATKSSDMLASFNNQSEFDGQSTVLIESSGSYIVSNSDFKSTNFFQYLYVYNDLTLDTRNSISQEMQSNESGEFYYKNAVGQDCVFRYSRMSASNWYCITCVPVSSFHTPVYSTNYAIYAALILFIMMVIDILWLQQMNRRLKMSMLHEKEASEAKTDFLSRMSHDIRTPLNGIIGLAALAGDEPNPPNTREYIENINVSGQFLIGLVNDILDMSRVESGKVELNPEPYSCRDLNKYVDAVVAPLCRDKSQTFQTSLPLENAPVLLDRLRFNQVIFNLLSNAVKYTPSGGLIELLWVSTELENNRVALDVTVKDNGIGISEEFQKHMFDSFSQEHSQTSTSGSGLGLAIVSSLVKLMNGQISVSSELNKGTAITIHLETDICEEKVFNTLQIVNTSLEGKRALVCEDNQINALIVNKMLEKWGVTSDIAENGEIGVELFCNSTPNTYDFILMDIMMPVMNGLDASQAIRKSGRPDAVSVPIIAMTANAYDTDVKNCLEAGMDAHMSKPIDVNQFRELLIDMTNRSSD